MIIMSPRDCQTRSRAAPGCRCMNPHRHHPFAIDHIEYYLLSGHSIGAQVSVDKAEYFLCSIAANPHPIIQDRSVSPQPGFGVLN
jgi:hypothetical protein